MTERMDDWNPPESWKRITCIMMIHAGHQNKEITVAAQCSLSTVRTIRHELENCDGDYEAVDRRKQHIRRSDCDGDYEAVARRKQHYGRSDCVHTAEFLQCLKKKVLKDPGIRIRALSRELNVSASTMKLALNEDLHYYSYKCRRGQLLTEKANENRLTKGRKLLSNVKHPAEPQTMWFFSDEKDFCQDEKHNMQNNRWLVCCPRDTHHVMQTEFSQTVMVFGCVSCEVDMMLPHFFSVILRLNSDAYVELLITVVKPWMTRVAICMATGFRPLPHLWEKSKMVVGEFLRLHQSQCLVSELPRS